MGARVDDHLRHGYDEGDGEGGRCDDGDFLSGFDWGDTTRLPDGDEDDHLTYVPPPQLQPARKRALAPESTSFPPAPGVGDDAGGLRRARGMKRAPSHRRILASTSASDVPYLLESVLSSAGPLPWEVERRITPQEEEREWARTTPEEISEIERDLMGVSIPARGRCGDGGNVSARRMHYRSTAGGGGTGSSCGGRSSAGAALLERCTRGDGGGADHAHRTRPPSDPVFTDDEREEILLPAMDAEIDAIPDEEKGAYLEARQRCPELTRDTCHRKAFVWRENFDAKRAAKRFVAYWEYRRELFGPRRCFLPMALSGALADDMVALSSGVIQILAERDKHGRSIVFFSFPKLNMSNYSRESMARAFWYVMHVAIEDPDTRRRGVVALVDGHSRSFNPFDPILYRRLIEIGSHCHIFCVRAMHYFRPGPLFHLLNPVVKALVPERLRKRLVTHCGSTDAVLRSVSSFGLHEDCLPSVLGGDVPEPDPVKWLSARMILEGFLSQKYSPLGSSGALPSDAELEKVGTGETESTAITPMDRAFESGQTSNALPPADSPSPVPCAADEPSPPDMSPPSPSMTSGHSDVASTLAVEKEEKKKKKGWRDPRMERAVEAKLANSEITLLDALIVGGFGFSADKSKALTDKLIKDETDGVSLFQRKNQLCRRLRMRKAEEAKLAQTNTTEPNLQVSTNNVSPQSKNNSIGANVDVSSQAHCKILKGVDPQSSVPACEAGKSHGEKGTAERGDPRMTRAVEAKRANPQVSLLDALIAGGFDFPKTKKRGETDKTVHDSDGVSLSQRKNQLRRRLRIKRLEDPRMSRAVAAKLQNPDISMVDALLEGGFKFPKLGIPGLCDKTILDTEKVNLVSRICELTKKLAELQTMAECDSGVSNADQLTIKNCTISISPKKERSQSRQRLTERSNRMISNEKPTNIMDEGVVDKSKDVLCTSSQSSRLDHRLATDKGIHKKYVSHGEPRQRKFQARRTASYKDIINDVLLCPGVERNDFHNPLVKHFGQEKPVVNSLFWGAEDSM